VGKRGGLRVPDSDRSPADSARRTPPRDLGRGIRNSLEHRVAFDGRLITIDEFHHVSIDEANVLGTQLKELLSRGQAHVVAMTGSYFRGDAAPVLSPEDEARFATVTYTYYEQLNGYQYLKSLDIGYWFYSGSYLEAIHEVLDPSLKTIVHIPT
jgi:hypothetical protein